MATSISSCLPSAEAVEQAGSKFKLDNWKDNLNKHKTTHPNIEKIINTLGLIDGQHISRRQVFDLARSDPEKGIILTIVWGFPRGTINGKRAPIEKAFQNAKAISDGLLAIKARGLADPQKLISEINEIAPLGVSTSTTSKWAYFFELPTSSGNCLIYDHRVINCIMEGTFSEFAKLQEILPSKRPKKSDAARTANELRQSALLRQPRTYGDYLRAVYVATQEIEREMGQTVTGGQIELGLFSKAPPKAVMAARTKARKKAKLPTL